MASPVGIEDQVNPVEPDAEETADNGAEQAVSAVELGVVHIRSHAEDGADTGKGRIAVQEKVNQGAERGGEGGFEVAQADMGQRPGRGLLHGIHSRRGDSPFFHKEYHKTGGFSRPALETGGFAFRRGMWYAGENQPEEERYEPRGRAVH